jgi:hypothetical protein
MQAPSPSFRFLINAFGASSSRDGGFCLLGIVLSMMSWRELLAGSVRPITGNTEVSIFDPVDFMRIDAVGQIRNEGLIAELGPSLGAPVAKALIGRENFAIERRVAGTSTFDVAIALCWNIGRDEAALVLTSWPSDQLPPITQTPAVISPSTSLIFL